MNESYCLQCSPKVPFRLESRMPPPLSTPAYGIESYTNVQICLMKNMLHCINFIFV